ncbi:MAG: complex I NDUFA9 subunit family protein [Azospirillaceae bacterium]
MIKRAGQAMTVTIFGGSGFIGRYIVQQLARRGHRVIVAARHPDRALFLKPLGTVGQIEPVFCNVRDDLLVEAALRQADIVINLVAILHESGRQTFQAVHVEAAERIARLAARNGASRLIHVSAIGADPAAQSHYARTKGEAEQAVLAAFPDATILRPSIVFGPEDAFFNRFAGMARYSPFLPLIGGGRTRFQPVYVGDVADAAMAALDDRASRGRTYELGGPQVFTFRELMRFILKETRRKRLLLPIPWWLARIQGAVLGLLPNPLLTSDQVRLLRRDNVVSDGAAGLGDLGIDPTGIAAIVPTYLVRFRVGGRFAGSRDQARGQRAV